MLNGIGDLFLDKVFFFRFSFLIPFCWRCMVLASNFLWFHLLLLGVLGLVPSIFLSPLTSCLYNIVCKCGGVLPLQ